MTKTAFTDVFLKKLKVPATGRAEHYDGKIPGFGLRVAKSGTKTFFVLGRHKGGFKRVSLGRYPTLTLEKARRKAQDALRDLEDGVDPIEAKRSARQRPADLFPAVVDDFVATYCKRNNRASTANETERLLKAVYVPRWAKKSVTDIRKADVAKVIDDIMAENKPSAARHAFATIRKFFNWSAERGLVEQSPCLTMKPPVKATNRDRVLSDDELAAILKATEPQGWPFGPIVRLLALTAQRRGEVVGMRWEEIDLGAKVWTIPGDRTKNHRPHAVPLTGSAIDIIKGLPRIDGTPFVFPARGYTDRPYSGYSKGKRELDKLAEQHDWTLHDLRRTAATGMARAGVQPHVVERVLNHVSGTFGGVAGVYNRFQYLDEMRAGLEAWERHLSTLATRLDQPKAAVPGV